MAIDPHQRRASTALLGSAPGEGQRCAGGEVTSPHPGDASRLLVDPGTGTEVRVPLGWRTMVLGDLLLPPMATAASSTTAATLAATLAEWPGPGVVVVCGDIGASTGPHAGPEDALRAHPVLASAIADFRSCPDRRVLYVPGWREQRWAHRADATSRAAALHLELASSVDLHLTTGSGARRVMIHPGPLGLGLGLGDPGLPDVDRAGPRRRTVAPGVADDPANRRWLSGIDRLEDPSGLDRFVTSRVLYRKLGRYAWWLLLPVAVALALRLPFVVSGLGHLQHGRSGAGRAIARASAASWRSRVIAVATVTAAELAVLLVVLGILSRRAWRALGGRALSVPWRRSPQAPRPAGSAGSAHGEAPDAEVGTTPQVGTEHEAARRAVADGATGLILGGSLQAELVELEPGFLARPGGCTEVVREHPGVVGLPPTFLEHRQVSWLEIETGAELHVRLVLGDAVLPAATSLERVATGEPVRKGRRPGGEVHPEIVSAWPGGTNWPPPPDLAGRRRHDRGMRRLTAIAIFVAGLVDVLVAVTPPLRGHLRFLQQVVPLSAAQWAGALVAVAGLALIMLARGVLRGQRRSWTIAVSLLTVTLVLHVVRGADLDSLGLSFLVLGILVVGRGSFRAATDRESTRSAATTLVVGVALATAAAYAVIEVSEHVRHRVLPSWPRVLLAIVERLVGIQSVALPHRINGFLAPTLLAVGMSLVLVSAYLATRPVVAHELSTGRPQARRAAELAARELVRRHGAGTLDYFALRDDKRWWFHHNSLVAYAVFGGVCLVSPDPIGPRNERAHVWDAFRRFADRHGWSVAVVAASEEWLPIYRESGMRFLYLGDEAVVDVSSFTLQGGKMKSLRQAYNRMRSYGYTVEHLDPATIDADLAGDLIDLMGRNRRGEAERGFSMTLSRVFDPRDTGLLLTVVRDPHGAPAAMCQFVPAPGIHGYSLDLMRRDPGEHPNGLVDMALCATVEHLRDRGMQGLSLNFAAMRATLEGEDGDGVTQRVERWALRQLSGILPIESLWRYNAKFRPSWLPRYIVYESPERFAPAVAAMMRAESLSEVPVIGRFLTAPAPSA